jgi:hypothetical protein
MLDKQGVSYGATPLLFLLEEYETPPHCGSDGAATGQDYLLAVCRHFGYLFPCPLKCGSHEKEVESGCKRKK